MRWLTIPGLIITGAACALGAGETALILFFLFGGLEITQEIIEAWGL
jgi:hypothetical protein